MLSNPNWKKSHFKCGFRTIKGQAFPLFLLMSLLLLLHLLRTTSCRKYSEDTIFLNCVWSHCSTSKMND